MKTGTLRRVPVFVFGLLGLLLGPGFTGCDRITPMPSAPANFAAPAPGRDEIYVAGPYRLSMSAYEGLRREFSGLSPMDLAQFALATQWFADVENTTPKDAAQCVRALFAPNLSADTVRQTEARLKSSFGIANLEALRERWTQFMSLSAINWNLPLARDYGFDPTSLGRNSR